MASFISALSLLILVLATGCFTLPVGKEQLSSSTLSSIHDDSTTEKIAELKLVPDHETTASPNVKTGRSLFEVVNVEVPVDSRLWTLGDYEVLVARTVDEHSTSKPMTATTEKSVPSKHGSDDLLSATVEPSTQVNRVEPSGVNIDSKKSTDVETKAGKREMTVELTTSEMSSSTPTSSTVAPELTTIQPTTSAQKYVGHLKGDEDDNDDNEKQNKPTKHTTSPRKPTTNSEEQQSEKSKAGLKDKSEENSAELQGPMAQFDQGALNKALGGLKDTLVLDENDDHAVTDVAEKSPTATLENKQQQNGKQTQEPKPLEQGKKQSNAEEKESDH